MSQALAPSTSSIQENYVGGEWRPSADGETYEKRNPARPSETVGRYAASDRADAETAVGAACEAAAGWAALPAPRRAAVLSAAAQALERRAEEVAGDMTAEMGKPLRESRMEVARGVQILRFFGGEAVRPVGERYAQSGTRGSVFTMRRPVGVVGLITPWNFPLAIPLWKLSPALVYGNACVLKLAYDAPRSGLHVAECLAEAEIPAGVLNVLTGEGARVGAALVDDPRVAAVSFTGSVGVGHGIRDAAVSTGKRVQLELGGQNPLLVMADANLDAAVEAAFAGAFWSAGQKCTATRRILVEAPLYDEFRARLVKRMERAAMGDPADAATEVGPIVNERQMTEVLEAIARGRDEGATLVRGGEQVQDHGYTIAPTLFEDVPAGGHLLCEEVFGPVTSLLAVADLEEALTQANAVGYGLCASIFTSSLTNVHRFQHEVQAGILHVNSQTAGAEPHVPFGGTKGSGYGPHEQGRAALEFYTDVVTVYEDVV